MDDETLKRLVQNACYSADKVALELSPFATGAEKTRAIITRALEALEANGEIVIVPMSVWNPFYYPDPPYENPFKEK